MAAPEQHPSRQEVRRPGDGSHGHDQEGDDRHADDEDEHPVTDAVDGELREADLPHHVLDRRRQRAGQQPGQEDEEEQDQEDPADDGEDQEGQCLKVEETVRADDRRGDELPGDPVNRRLGAWLLPSITSAPVCRLANGVGDPVRNAFTCPLNEQLRPRREGSAFAEIVACDPEVEASGSEGSAPRPRHRIDARGLQRRGMPVTAVDELHPGRARQLDRFGLVIARREAEVADPATDVHGHAHTSGHEQLVGVRIFLSWSIFHSSDVYPSSRAARLQDHVAGDGPVPDLAGCDRRRRWQAAGRRATVTLRPLLVNPATPTAPETDWYVETTMRPSLAARCSGAIAVTGTAVVQFATGVPFGIQQVVGVDLGRPAARRVHAWNAAGCRRPGAASGDGRPFGGDGVVDVDDHEISPSASARSVSHVTSPPVRQLAAF